MVDSTEAFLYYMFFKKKIKEKKIVRGWNGVRGPVVRNSDCSSRGLLVGFSASKWWLTTIPDSSSRGSRQMCYTYIHAGRVLIHIK